MLVVVVNSVLLWTLIGDLLGQYIFIGIAVCSCTVFLALHCEERIRERKMSQKKVKEESMKEKRALQRTPTEAYDSESESDDDQDQDQENTTTNTNNNFKIKSATTSIWLPCVVGSTSNMFLTSALASIASKVVLLVVAVLLTHFKVIETNVFLLWCHDPPTAEAKVREHNESNFSWSLEMCQEPSINYTSCYTEESELSQKVRVCAPPETEVLFRLVLLLVVFASTREAYLAVFKLHGISNYYTLWEKTRRFLCFPTEQVVHRSLVFELAGNDMNCEKLERFLGLDTQALSPPANASPPFANETQIQAVNRPRRGVTPLQHAAENGATECVWALWWAGALFTEELNVLTFEATRRHKMKIREFYLSRGQVMHIWNTL